MTTHEETGRRVRSAAAGRPRSIPPGRNTHTMTTDPAEQFVAEARRAVHEALVVLPAWEADRVRALIADLETAVEGRTAIRMADEPASAGLGVSATPSRTDLRQRIAAAVRRQAETGNVRYEALADAVLAELPPPADRTPVLLSEAERLMLRHALDLADANISARPDEYTAADEAALASLRGLADEAQQQECTASISGSCLREAESETACDTEAGECVHGGRPGAPEPESEPPVHGESVAHLAGLHDDDTVHACPGRWGGPNCRCFDDEPAANAQAAVDEWRGATEVISDAEVERLAATGLVGYRQGRGRLLYCLHHKPAPVSRYVDFHEVTSDDLPDGGICVHPRCGADLLAVQPAADARQDGEA